MKTFLVDISRLNTFFEKVTFNEQTYGPRCPYTKLPLDLIFHWLASSSHLHICKMDLKLHHLT